MKETYAAVERHQLQDYYFQNRGTSASTSHDAQERYVRPRLSYAATLWPMLRPIISADRGDSHPRGVEYPVIDLALDELINAVGLEELDPKFSLDVRCLEANG